MNNTNKNRTSSIIISQCGPFLGWVAAQKAYQEGWLQKFVTTKAVRDCVPRAKMENLNYIDFPASLIRRLNSRIFHSARLSRWEKSCKVKIKEYFDKDRRGLLGKGELLFIRSKVESAIDEIRQRYCDYH